MLNWYYYDNNGHKIGPISSKALEILALSGFVKADTIVVSEDGRNYTAADIPGLISNLDIKDSIPSAAFVRPPLPSKQVKSPFDKIALTQKKVERKNNVEKRRKEGNFMRMFFIYNCLVLVVAACIFYVKRDHISKIWKQRITPKIISIISDEKPEQNEEKKEDVDEQQKEDIEPSEQFSKEPPQQLSPLSPMVITCEPQNGQTVKPGKQHLRITFDKDMDNSYTGRFGAYKSPFGGMPLLIKRWAWIDNRTLEAEVELKPDTRYKLYSANCMSKENIKQKSFMWEFNTAAE